MTLAVLLLCCEKGKLLKKLQEIEGRMRWQILFAVVLLTHPLLAKEPQLKCEKKFGQVDWEGMIFHRYALRAENFPPKQTFRLIVKSFDGTETETFRYYANHRGHLIFQPSEKENGDVYAICPAKRGERLTFLMKSENNEEAYSTEIVPFPLEMKSKKGIKLSLELQGEQGEKFLLLARGFNPNEQVRLLLQINGKKTDLKPSVTVLGDLCTHVHIPLNSEEGEAKLVLSRKNEKVVFPFKWGAPALELVGACCFEIK